MSLNGHLFILLNQLPAVLRHLNMGEKIDTEAIATRPPPLNSSQKTTQL